MARLNFRQAAVQMQSRLTGDERQRELVALAHAAIDEATRVNTAAIGREVGRTIIVDGRQGAPVESVKIGGTVVALFAVHEAAVDFAWETLAGLSPVDQRPDADDIVYRDRHLMLVDGVEVAPPIKIEPDSVVTFVNLLAYARRIEKGWSKKQAPDGVYEVAVPIIRSRFGRLVNVKFGYGAFLGASAVRENRYPYIELSPKRSRV